MKETNSLIPGGIFLLKSHSCGNTCFFESQEEIKLFKRLLKINLKKYLRIHHVVLGIEGYQMLVKVKDSRTLISNYQKELSRSGKTIKPIYLEEPWRIISEKIRIMHSVYAKTINKLRERTGVLVKSKYRRYYFESVNEAIKYIEDDTIEIQKSQLNSKYCANPDHSYILNWAFYKTKKWLSGLDLLHLNRFSLRGVFQAGTLQVQNVNFDKPFQICH